MNTPCDVKVLYDTEFEAERAASIAEHEFKSEMTWYRCGRHYHIANKRKKNRSKNRKVNRSWCVACQTYMKPQNYARHITLVSHQANEYRRKKEHEKEKETQ